MRHTSPCAEKDVDRVSPTISTNICVSPKSGALSGIFWLKKIISYNNQTDNDQFGIIFLCISVVAKNVSETSKIRLGSFNFINRGEWVRCIFGIDQTQIRTLDHTSASSGGEQLLHCDGLEPS